MRLWPFALSTKPPIMIAAMHESIVSHSDVLNDETEPSASPIEKKYNAVRAIRASIATTFSKNIMERRLVVIGYWYSSSRVKVNDDT